MEVALNKGNRFWFSLRANRWFWLLAFFAVILSVPVFTVLISILEPFSQNWEHLSQTVLRDYIVNSVILMLGVAAGTFILGVSCAWLVTMYEFSGRRFLEWGLLLPMAMPAYIIAYAYTGTLDFSGPVQTFIREVFTLKYGDYWFPEVRSLGGAVCMFSLVLYPYVYLIVRAAFVGQSRSLIEVSRSLGLSPLQTFYKVALPVARPAIVAGLTLALMETLADYGTVAHFGVSTFTTGIFRTWFGLGDLTAAAQLASVLLLFVVTLIVVERVSRRRLRYTHTTTSQRPVARVPLLGSAKWLVCIWCFAPFIFGFFVPAIQLAGWAIRTWQKNLNMDFLVLIQHSFLLAASASIICLFIALVVCFAQRINRERRSPSVFLRAATLGYAVPGTVIAVGVLIPIAALDKKIDQLFMTVFSVSPGLIFSGTLFAVVFAYVVRFISVSVQTVESGYSKIQLGIDDSTRTLGQRPTGLLARIHFPMLKVSVVTALLLVFVDVLKELPTTLILRPFNFNTLAVRAYELASDERLADAAMPALAIVFAGIIPVVLLSRAMRSPLTKKI